MNRFLYYDQDSINSLIAQIEQGLLVGRTVDEVQGQTTSTTQKTQSNITGDLSAKVLGIGTSIKGDIKETDTDTEIATQLVRSVQEKALHDYAFERIFFMNAAYLKVKNIVFSPLTESRGELL